jgi:hypothetical protein
MEVLKMFKKLNIAVMVVLALMLAFAPVAFADTYDLADNQTAKPGFSYGKFYVLENEVSFASQNGAQNDVIQALNIPADTLVIAVAVEVTTAEGEASTVDVGITGGDTDGFLDGISLATVDILTDTDAGYLASVQGYHFTAADTIDLLLPSAVTYDTAVLTIRAYCIDLSALY